MKYFNVLIRVVKSINTGNEWWSYTVLQKFIKAENKEEAKKIILEEYPQFFQNWKIYTRETKDQAQFFYVLIYEFSDFYKKEIEEEWKCDFCWKIHKNQIEEWNIITTNRKFPWKKFCSSLRPRLDISDNIDFEIVWDCAGKYEEDFYKKWNLEDNTTYVWEKSSYFIYKITEKKTGKSYIWQTRNFPVFRWYQHWTKSKTPFWKYFQKTKIADWTFEVLEELLYSTEYDKVLGKESYYIKKYNSIENWFNSLISKK